MKKTYNYLTIGLLSLFTIILASCGKGNDDLRKMDTFDVVMSIFFVILIAFVVGVFIYIIIKHYRNR
jgi:FtsH-binding integral membrane protein